MSGDLRSDWLLAHRRNVHSQFGEDGILEEVFRTLGERNRWCVELGAYDGLQWSNTRHLITEHGYRAVLIEANPRRFRELERLYRGEEAVHLLRSFVTFEGRDSLDDLLARTDVPEDFDLLSLDVDGNEYHLWRSLRRYRPRVVVVEFNPTIPPDLEVVQAPDRQSDCGASLAALCRLGRELGYQLVATTDANAIFVGDEDFPRFAIADNRPAVLWREFMPRYLMQLYQKYDGTLVLTGNDRLVWHRMRIPQRSIQVLPRFLRFYPGNDTFLLRIVKRLYYRFVAEEKPPATL